MSTRNKIIRITFFYGLLFCLLSNEALSQSNFYEGKTVTLIATTSAGGTGDLRVKAMVPFLKKHIPGNPTVVIQYIDGGGGRKGTNYLYSNVRPDGLTIGAASGAIIGLAVMGETGVSYDIESLFIWAHPKAKTITLFTPAKNSGSTIWKNSHPSLASGSERKRSAMY
ncbi:MAG: hypothetical protein WAL47_07285, partial [Pyrinomonadaceae bacterium]